MLAGPTTVATRGQTHFSDYPSASASSGGAKLSAPQRHSPAGPMLPDKIEDFYEAKQKSKIRRNVIESLSGGPGLQLAHG